MLHYRLTLIVLPRIIKYWLACVVGIAWSVVYAADKLPQELEDALNDSGFNAEGIGLYIQAVDEATPLVSFQARQSLNPASVIKLVTTAAALAQLGQGYRWSTDIYYTGNIQGNELKGDLYFYGNGDPYLTPERFWRLLSRVSIYGIENIGGNIYLDSTYFLPDPVDYAAFDEQPYRTYNVGPNAVLVGFQATEFHFDIAKNKVRITPFPKSPKLKVINKIRLVNGGCGAWQKRLTLATKSVADILQVTFNGRYARGCAKRTLYRRVTEANDHFQHFFLPLWRQLGGSFDGIVAQGVLPKDAKLVVQGTSISLGEAVRMINKFSNNVMTRQVLLSLGAQIYGAPGTTDNGIQAITTWLARHGLDDPALQLDNGAGLSRDTRISAAQLGRLLYHVFQQPYMPEFVASMPVAGYDGTMAKRFQDEPLMGSAHIKTGLLDYVQTMAGYITAASEKRYIVVLLHNHPRAHTKAGERLQNRVIRWVYDLKQQS